MALTSRRKAGLSWQSTWAKPKPPGAMQLTGYGMQGFPGTPAPPMSSAPAAPGSGVAAPAAPSGPAPLPFGIQNQATHLKDQAQQQLNMTLAELQDRQNQALLDYGYNASFDPQGNLSGLTVDPKDPFSRAQLLQRFHDQSQRGATTAMSAQGQLYSGALQNARNANTFNFQQQTDAQQKELQALLKELIRRRLEAKTGAANAATNIDDNAIIQALAGGV